MNQSREVSAVLLSRPGLPPALRLAPWPPDQPGPGELLLRVHACGLNPVDVKLAATGAPQWQWPHVLGLDIVGRVEASGDSEHAGLVGTTVAVHQDLGRQGGLAQLAVVAADMVAPVPDGADPVQAAAVPCPGLTAWQAVHRTRVGGDDRVLIIGAGGGVGTFATQLAAERLDGNGAVVAVVGPRDLSRVVDLGADESFDYTAGPVDRTVGGRFDVVLDLVGVGPSPTDMLSYGGRLASVTRPSWGTVAPFTTAPTLVELALGAVYAEGSHADRRRLAGVLGDLLGRVHAGDLQVPAITVGMPEDAPSLMRSLADGKVRGKLVIDWR